MPTPSSRHLHCILIAALCALLGACARKPPAAPPSPPPPPLTQWPQGVTAPLKITDQLTLEIPLQYERTAIEDGRGPRSPFQGIGGRTEARFDFFLPDFSGYTLQNYRNELDENKVEVAYLHAGDPHEADAGAPGEYPPNMLERSLKEHLNPKDYRDMNGLRCYTSRVLSDRLTCYGRRDAAAGEDILLYVPVVASATSQNAFPTLKVNYFSRKYGGVRIAWRTHVRNLPRWHDIDAQIWRFIDAWNVAREPPAQPAQPAQSPAKAPQ